MKKQEILDMIGKLPEDLTAEDLMYRLYLKAKLDQAEAAVERGDVLSHEEVVRQTDQWFE